MPSKQACTHISTAYEPDFLSYTVYEPDLSCTAAVHAAVSPGPAAPVIFPDVNRHAVIAAAAAAASCSQGAGITHAMQVYKDGDLASRTEHVH